MKYYDINELKESNLMMNKETPKFGLVFTFLTFLLIISLICLATFSKKTYVVKANSVVASEEKVNLMNIVSGSINHIYVKEGEILEEGQKILSISTFQVDIQIDQIRTTIKFYQKKIEIYDKLILFINNFTLDNELSMINPFSVEDSDESKAYVDAQSFIDYIDNQSKNAEANDDNLKQEDVEQLKVQFLTQQYTSLDQLKLELEINLSKEIMYIESLKEYVLIANQKGKIHFNASLSIGTVLQAGSFLGTISSTDDTKLYFDAIMKAADRNKVDINCEVEIAVIGVSQNEYGVLKGKIINIDSDSTQTEDGTIYYKLKIKTNSMVLKNKKEIKVISGMIAECRIKYNQITWIKWFFDQMGVRI